VRLSTGRLLYQKCTNSSSIMRALGQLHRFQSGEEHLSTTRGDAQSAMCDSRLGVLYGEVLGMAVLCPLSEAGGPCAHLDTVQ
jgi:hypothetical protein